MSERDHKLMSLATTILSAPVVSSSALVLLERAIRERENALRRWSEDKLIRDSNFISSSVFINQ